MPEENGPTEPIGEWTVDKHKATQLAEAFAKMSVFQKDGGGYENENALLEWLKRIEETGWTLALGSSYVPGQSSILLVGMFVEEGAWEKRESEGLVSHWNGLDEGWTYRAGRLTQHCMEWGESRLEEGYRPIYRQGRESSAREDYWTYPDFVDS